MINFTVNFDVDDMRGKTVLVFLRPELPQRNYQIHAWKVLTGAPHSSETFSYRNIIEADVSSTEEGRFILSGRMTVTPGQLLQTTAPNGLAPILSLAPTSLAQAKLTPQQCGIINKTNPYTQFDANWYVDGCPVVTMPYVDLNMTVSFEHLPKLYFMVATPPLVGQTYIVQNFSDMTSHVPPPAATDIEVTLTRASGLWQFDFKVT